MALDITGKVGWWGGSVNVAPSVDADAQTFITAANITDSTQQSAINTLVTQLKTYGIWTKMKALYPFVGGTASSHKFNLKDPRDLDAAYRLVFAGGWTHSSTGALPNGSNAYADTKLNLSTSGLNLNSLSMAIYLRTNFNNLVGDIVDIGAENASSTNRNFLQAANNSKVYVSINSNGANFISTTDTNSMAMYIANRTSSTVVNLFKNNTKIIADTSKPTSALTTVPIYLGAFNLNGIATYYSVRQQAFASIGDGLTDTEAANFYTAVQTFQTTLGRQVGVPIVADTDAQAFLNAAVITNQTQANAINTLVTDLKSANIWTKMKAIYPFVGGTATTHKFNLKDPRDLDAAFRLTFSGGWTHSATGVLPNGTNAWADTKLVPSTDLSTNSGFGWYSITNSSTTSAEMGALNYDMPSVANVRGFQVARNSGTIYVGVNSQDFQTFSDTDTRGFYQAYRTNSTTVKTLKNTTLYTATLPYYATPLSCYIGARNERNIAQVFSNKGLALAYFQSNFTDADATALYNAVQAYQTTLGRQI